MQRSPATSRFGFRLFLATAGVVCLAVSGGLAADSTDGVWKSVDGSPGGSPKSYTGLKNDAFKVFSLNAAGLTEQFTYVSTAGGAFLEWMEGKPLPGVEVLRQK